MPDHADLADRIFTELRARLYVVDAPPVTLRDDPKAIKRMERSAGSLLEAIQELKGWGDIDVSLRNFFTDRNWEYDSQALGRVLLVLRDAQSHLFEPYNPTDGYHRQISLLRDVIRGAGGKVAVHEDSQFVAFLIALDTEWPGLIFPPGTVATGRGRCRYVERALSGE